MAEEKSGKTLAAGVTGAIIGAAAAAAAIALSDEKNRKKAEKVLSDLEKQGNSIFKQVSKLALELKDRGTKALPKQSLRDKSLKQIKARKAVKKSKRKTA